MSNHTHDRPTYGIGDFFAAAVTHACFVNNATMSQKIDFMRDWVVIAGLHPKNPKGPSWLEDAWAVARTEVIKAIEAAADTANGILTVDHFSKSKLAYLTVPWYFPSETGMLLNVPLVPSEDRDNVHAYPAFGTEFNLGKAPILLPFEKYLPTIGFYEHELVDGVHVLKGDVPREHLRWYMGRYPKLKIDGRV